MAQLNRRFWIAYFIAFACTIVCGSALAYRERRAVKSATRKSRKAEWPGA